LNTELAGNAENKTAPIPGCAMCRQVFDPNRIVVCDTEYFVGYVTPIYPWAVMFTTLRHDCDGPWALTEDEAVDLGRLILRITAAIRKTGSERTYVLVFGEEAPMAQFGEDVPMPHFHIGFLSRYVPLSEAERAVMHERVANSTTDPVQLATDFAAGVRANL
jgi:hypothetical protein